MMRDTLPLKTRWTRRGLAKHLGCNKETVGIYADKIAMVIKDYRAECPRDSEGNVKSGFALSQYQAWVVAQLIKMARIIGSDMNGTAYRQVVKANAFKLRESLSKQGFNAEMNQLQSA